MTDFNYRIKHIAINNPDAETASELSKELCAAFNLEVQFENPVAIMTGSIFEVMKHSRRGTMGHIALQTDDVELAMADLKAKGYEFLEETARYDENGKCNFIFLKKEFGGFMIHLCK